MFLQQQNPRLRFLIKAKKQLTRFWAEGIPPILYNNGICETWFWEPFDENKKVSAKCIWILLFSAENNIPAMEKQSFFLKNHIGVFVVGAAFATIDFTFSSFESW